jgi:hypothetical protein
MKQSGLLFPACPLCEICGSLIKQACMLAAQARDRCGICQCTWQRAQARKLFGSLYYFSLYEQICLFYKQARLLAIISKLGEGGLTIAFYG